MFTRVEKHGIDVPKKKFYSMFFECRFNWLRYKRIYYKAKLSIIIYVSKIIYLYQLVLIIDIVIFSLYLVCLEFVNLILYHKNIFLIFLLSS